LIERLIDGQDVQFNKAPGHERFIDYEAKRVMAELAKAAQPRGARAPSGEFTGYLFSNSMPQQVCLPTPSCSTADDERTPPIVEGARDGATASAGREHDDGNAADDAVGQDEHGALESRCPCHDCAQALPSATARPSLVMQSTVPEHMEVHHTRRRDETGGVFSGSNSPPSAHRTSCSLRVV